MILVTISSDNGNLIAQPRKACINLESIEIMLENYAGQGTIIRGVSGNSYVVQEELEDIKALIPNSDQLAQ